MIFLNKNTKYKIQLTKMHATSTFISTSINIRLFINIYFLRSPILPQMGDVDRPR